MPGFLQMSDDALADGAARFAAVAAVVLRDPDRWLGWGADEPSSLPGRAVDVAERVVLGSEHPGSDGWDALAPDKRAAWWVRRLSTLGSAVAAAPRFGGLAADRFPLQAALGATVQGLTICAVAREHGVSEPADWVPLLGQVLFDRELSRADRLPEPAAEKLLTGAGGPSDDEVDRALDASRARAPEADEPHPVRRAAHTTYRLARTLVAAQGMFDERPRGARIFRLVGKIPVVGLLGGFLDERGGVRAAARETTQALAARDRPPPAAR